MLNSYFGLRVALTNILAIGCAALALVSTEWAAELRAQEYEVSVEWLDFGFQRVGSTSASAAATAINYAEFPITVTGVVIEGVNAAEFTKVTDGCTGRTLSAGNGTGGAGGTCSVSVTFTPQAIGVRAAWLVVRHDGPEVTSEGGLKGAGEDPCMTDSPPTADGDEDGLYDCWETHGIGHMEGANFKVDLDLKALGADPEHKDLFVEIDYMDCAKGGCAAGDRHSHYPGETPDGTVLPHANDPLNQVTDAFRNAPLTNRDGIAGIRLHAEVDEPLRHVATIRFNTVGGGVNDDFNDLKLGNPQNPCGTATNARFATSADRKSANCARIVEAKRKVYRYAIFGHNHDDFPGDAVRSQIGSSGRAEIGGNDFVVTLRVNEPAGTDDFARKARTAATLWAPLDATFDTEWADTVAGTFMHELGHTLGLDHGGADGINCKPNYLSVMSYARQFNSAGRPANLPISPTYCVQYTTELPVVDVCRVADGRSRLDYSRERLDSLGEPSLNEPLGINGPATRRTLFGGPNPAGGGRVSWVAPAQGPIDWNRNGDSSETKASADINDIPGLKCTSAFPDWMSTQIDWEKLDFVFRDSPAFGDGATATDADPVREQTDADYINGIVGDEDLDRDGLQNPRDNCPLHKNPDQADADGDGFGDACEYVDLAVDNTAAAAAVGLGDALTYTVNLRSQGTQTAHDVILTTELPAGVAFGSFAINGGTCTGTQTITCTLGDLVERATATLTISASAWAVGEMASTARVSGSDAEPIPADNSSTARVVVVASNADVRLAPASLTFGDQRVGTASAVQSVMLTNSGSGPLVIRNVTTVGPDAADFVKSGDTCTGARVAADATCVIGISFTPTAFGARSAFLSIEDNASGSPHTVPLDGRGVNPTTGSIAVVGPNKAVNWGIGSTQPLKWSHTLGKGTAVKIELSRDGGATYPELIVASLPNSAAKTGTYNWQVSGPATIAARIRVSAVDGSPSDSSDVNFTVAAPFITVTAPKVHASWGYDTTQKQTWSTNLGPLDRIDVTLSADGGAHWSALTGGANIAATKKSAHILAPALSAPVAHARARVQWTNPPAGVTPVEGMSPLFTIEPPFVTVTAPAAGAVWAVGTTQSIRWTDNLGSLETVKIELSRDGGGTYPATVAAVTPADRKHPLTVQAGWGSQTTSRMKVTWLKVPAVSAETADFTIE